MTSIRFPRVDLPRVCREQLPAVDLDRLASRATALASEAAYTAIGFAVIAARSARQQGAAVRAFVEERLSAAGRDAPEGSE